MNVSLVSVGLWKCLSCILDCHRHCLTHRRKNTTQHRAHARKHETQLVIMKTKKHNFPFKKPLDVCTQTSNLITFSCFRLLHHSHSLTHPLTHSYVAPNPIAKGPPGKILQARTQNKKKKWASKFPKVSSKCRHTRERAPMTSFWGI